VRNEVNERTALWKKRDMGHQDGTEAAEWRSFLSLFCSREVEKYKTISANFLYQMDARMEFLRTTGRLMSENSLTFLPGRGTRIPIVLFSVPFYSGRGVRR
jgi:hypothetical protein